MTTTRSYALKPLLSLMSLFAIATAAAQYVSAQAAPAAESASHDVSSSDGSKPVGPPERGFFASSSSTVGDDSVSGWSAEVSPSLAYHFSPAVSVDASVPYYLYLNAVKTTKNGLTRLIGHEDAVGDAAFAGHVHLSSDWFDYTFTAATGLPTGDISLGLSSGQMTWNINNRLEQSLAMFTPDFEAGFGDSSTLIRESAKKNYTTIGDLAFFQAGSSVDLPRGTSLEVDAYEQLPVGKQTVYTTVVRKKKTTTTLTSTSDADDHGMEVSFDLPLTKRLDFSTDYSYSIPLQDSSLGFTVSILVWKPTAR